MTRDRLLGMLWAETDEERARKGLNQALYALRQEMGADEVFLGSRDLRLNSDLVTSDVAVFRPQSRPDSSSVQPRNTSGHSSTGSTSRRRRSSSAGWRRSGPAWRGTMRPPSSAGRRAAERGDGPGAVEWWRKLAAQDPLNARVAIGLMEALVATGDRTAALQHARVHEALLHQELEAPPDREVLALAEAIRRQPVERRRGGATAGRPARRQLAARAADTPPDRAERARRRSGGRLVDPGSCAAALRAPGSAGPHRAEWAARVGAPLGRS